LIRAYRTAENASHFAIDAFRNPYEAEYFRRRYEEFYLIGVLRNDSERHGSLAKNLSAKGIQKLESRERGNAIVRRRDNISEWVTSQNIEEILQKADVFIKNVFDHGKSYPHLRFNLAKLISLAKNPGCVNPTVDERSMQIAMTARRMSGCISRQVGAVLVNDKDYVLGIGWNDPPEGQITCALRTGKELVDGPSNGVFSEYEKCCEFVSHIRKKHYAELPFCFRSEFSELSGDQGSKAAEYTRALHAEENALFQAVRNVGDSIEGAILYTTASPCTLCAKKAYQLGIKRIVYIEEYPGIAVDQTLRIGAKRVEVTQFEGITGSAYFRFFSSLMPEKDLIQLYI
jgi:deoxycytidylate deaminase